MGPDCILICGDAREMIQTLQAGDVDVVVTDPPYGIDGGSSGAVSRARAKGSYGSSCFVDTTEYVKTVVVPCIEALRGLCNCVVVTPGNRNFHLYPQPDSFGCFYQPAAIGLQTFGNLDAQPIFYYGKNAIKRNMGVPCSYQLTEKPEKNGHPCVKPIKIWTRLVCNVSLPGHIVVDPFMGSGTTGVSAVSTGRRFIGSEIEEKYFDIAVKRITEAQVAIGKSR